MNWFSDLEIHLGSVEDQIRIFVDILENNIAILKGDEGLSYDSSWEETYQLHSRKCVQTVEDEIDIRRS